MNIIIVFQYLSFEAFRFGIGSIFFVPCDLKAFYFVAHCDIHSFLHIVELCFQSAFPAPLSRGETEVDQIPPSLSSFLIVLNVELNAVTAVRTLQHSNKP